MKPLTALFLAAAVFTVPSLASAEVLLMDAIKEAPANNAEGLYRPRAGQSMEQVRRQHGAALTEHPWVGDPPITRWDYAGYSVFFEHERVINTVVHRQ